jgi:hypothetical protein
VALIVGSLTKIAVESDALIEDETLAGPEIVGVINLG